MKHYFGDAIIIHDECREAMRKMSANSIDSCVTDPPYHLTSIVKRFSKVSNMNRDINPNKGIASQYHRVARGFMGETWDGGDIAFQPALWKDVYRVLKPGGYLLAFAATRNYHRMACAIEDAGFEIRDCIQWIYGSGFPKSHNISKGIDKKLGHERSKVQIKADFVFKGWKQVPTGGSYEKDSDECVSAKAEEWDGFGTALKPAVELIVMARKPLSEKTIVANILRWGTGALNIDGCRIALLDGEDTRVKPAPSKGWCISSPTTGSMDDSAIKDRWPANVITDGSDEVVGALPITGPSSGAQRNNSGAKKSVAKGQEYPRVGFGHADMGGSVARLFYTAKASKRERQGSDHPTVKPLSLMRYLVRLVTPPNGKVLDPFGGTGTTGEAALL